MVNTRKYQHATLTIIVCQQKKEAFLLAAALRSPTAGAARPQAPSRRHGAGSLPGQGWPQTLLPGGSWPQGAAAPATAVVPVLPPYRSTVSWGAEQAGTSAGPGPCSFVRGCYRPLLTAWFGVFWFLDQVCLQPIVHICACTNTVLQCNNTSPLLDLPPDILIESSHSLSLPLAGGCRMPVSRQLGL